MIDNYQKIYLYHGSDCIVSNPDINKCRPNKDFGKGFYLTSDRKQAIKFAKLVARRNNSSKGYLNVFYLEKLFTNACCFEDCDEDWLLCVIGNREERFKEYSNKWNKWDVIIGKIADDDTARTINAYLVGAYGKVGSKKATETAISMLLPNNLKDQICFKSNRSLKLLKYIETIEVKLDD